MDPVSLLCEIIGQAGKVAAQAYRDDVRYGALLDAGLIKRDGVVQSVVCQNCVAPHDAEIVFEGGSYGHYCPELGFVPFERSELVAMRPNLTKLVDQLHVAFGCQPGSTSQLGPHTWRIGLVDMPGGRAVVYFHPRLLDDDDLNHFETFLRTEIRREHTLIVTAAGHLQYQSVKTCILTQMVQLDMRADHIQQRVSVAEAVGAPLKRAGGRPNLHRERAFALMGERVERGLEKVGRNEEAKTILAVYVERYPNLQPPKLSTLKAYVSEFRRG